MSMTREPPHSGEAERAVLGSILIDCASADGEAERILDLCIEGGITPESFFEPRNATVYRAILELHRTGAPTDAATLINRLRADGTLDGIGGAIYVQSLIDGTPTTAHAESYIYSIRETHLRREIANFGMTLAHDAFDENRCPDIESVRAKAETNLLALGERTVHGEPTTAEAAQAAGDALIRQLHADPDTVDGLLTGFTALDDVLDGLKPGEVTVIGARPSEGKTSLAMNIAENLALGADGGAKRNVLVFSLEMKRDALLMRMIKGRSGANPTRKSRRYMTPTQIADAEERLTKATAEVKTISETMTIVESIRDIGEIRSRARRERKHNHIELIVVDYLQLCTCNTARRLNSRQLEVSEISWQIKAMAQELNVPVIVPSQLSRANQKDGKSRKPRLCDLRDSGSIEQDADVVILLHRPCRDPKSEDDSAEDIADRTLAILDVAKNRNGETNDNVRLNFNAECTRFGNRPASDV